MPREASPKRERQYLKIKKSAQKPKPGAKKATGRAGTEASRGRSGSSPAGRSANGRVRSARSRSSAGRRGFASMSAARQRQIASQGGRAAHAQGTAHEFSPAEARRAGQKGGEVVSRDRRHMAAIGRKGGER